MPDEILLEIGRKIEQCDLGNWRVGDIESNVGFVWIPVYEITDAARPDEQVLAIFDDGSVHLDDSVVYPDLMRYLPILEIVQRYQDMWDA